MKKLDNLRKQLDSVIAEITKLSDFRDTSLTRKFKRQLEGEKSFIQSEIKKLSLTKSDKEIAKQEKKSKANKNRSSKNKRVWNYVKSVQKNYRPDLSLKAIRTLLKKHRQGLETDIPDVAWRNPSP